MSSKRFPQSALWLGSTLALLLLALVAHTPTAYADGMFAKERLQKELPAIPWQRAIIVHKDSVERLTIQSAVDAEGATLGWIVPVPPTEISKGSAGAVAVLSAYMQPSIVDWRQSRGTKLKCSWMAIVCSLWAVVLVLGKPSWKKLFVSIPILLLVASIPWVLASVFGGTKAAGTLDAAPASAGARTVTVESTAIIGSYDVATLKAEKAEDLRAWLSENGFSELSGDGDRIVQDYLAEGWRFVAAKLRREGNGVATPHPLMITFPAQRPIYPMRLTALSASDVYLELFVVSNAGASQDLLTREYCSGPLEDFGSKEEHSYHMRGVPYSLEHTGLVPYLWKGATITKLTGTLRPQDMGSDLAIESASRAYYRQTLYTQDAVKNFGVIWGCRVWSVVLFAGIVICFPYMQRSAKARWASAFALVAVGGALAGVSGAIAKYRLPVTEVAKNAYIEPDYQFRPFNQLRGIAEAHDWFHGAPLDEIARIYRAYFTYTVAVNPYTGARIAFDDAPGNVTIEQDDTAVTVRTYEIYTKGESETIRLTGNREDDPKKKDAPSPKDPATEAIEQLYDNPTHSVETLSGLYSERAVGPLIEWLGKVERKEAKATGDDVYEAIDTIEQTTGYRFGEKHEKLPNQAALWAAWWEKNKDKTRVQWLREALDTTTHIWPPDINTVLSQLTDPRYASLPMITANGKFVSEAVYERFAGLVRNDGFEDAVIDMLRESDDPRFLEIVMRDKRMPLRLLTDGRGYAQALKVCESEPDRFFSLLSDDLGRLIHDKNREMEIAFEASALGLITHTVPPANVNDRKAMVAFLEKVSAYRPGGR